MRVKAGTLEGLKIEKVFVDGAEVKYCTYFDDEEGVAICLKYSSEVGSIVILEQDGDNVKTITHRGKITYTLFKDEHET